MAYFGPPPFLADAGDARRLSEEGQAEMSAAKAREALNFFFSQDGEVRAPRYPRLSQAAPTRGSPLATPPSATFSPILQPFSTCSSTSV